MEIDTNHAADWLQPQNPACVYLLEHRLGMNADPYPNLPQGTAPLPPVDDPEMHLQRLLAAEERPWFTSFIQNVKETLNPPKLPPLELTSKPVEVQDIWGFYGGQEKRAGLTSLLIHGSVIAALFLITFNPAVQQKAKDVVTLIAPDIAPLMPVKKTAMGGGGGGGDRSPTPASKGRVPKISDKQFVPPNVKPPEHAKLTMEPTIVAQLDAPIPQVNMTQIGDPLAKSGILSNGVGAGGGIGSGRGGGIGSGNGAGFGPGSGGGFGGGVYKIGGGVSPPQVLYRVEPDYSEEARKAKYQGTVTLSIIVDDKGQIRDVKVIRPLGLGLDQKAIEAVEKWRFKPGMKDGHAVAVNAYVEVNFRLL